MSSDKNRPENNSSSDIDWTPENEIKLFYALRGHKPVGVSKNFHMISILEEFSKLTERDISSKMIWDRLEKLYDMDTLHENENLPFPTNAVPFTIEGIKEFDELIAKTKAGTDAHKSDKSIDAIEETEANSNQTKTWNKGKLQESSKTNTKVKLENDKSCKSERKEDIAKNLEKSDDAEEKGNRSKKQMTKTNAELRSSQSAIASAKKRK